MSIWNGCNWSLYAVHREKLNTSFCVSYNPILCLKKVDICTSLKLCMHPYVFDSHWNWNWRFEDFWKFAHIPNKWHLLSRFLVAFDLVANSLNLKHSFKLLVIPFASKLIKQLARVIAILVGFENIWSGSWILWNANLVIYLVTLEILYLFMESLWMVDNCFGRKGIVRKHLKLRGLPFPKLG